MIVNKLGIKATIPVAQYANIQPELELQSVDLKEGTELAMDYVKELFARYSEKGALKENESGVTIKVKSFNEDVEIDFDPVQHKYYYNGNRLISASSWVGNFYKDFDAPTVAAACAKSWEVEADSIVNMWNSTGKVAAGFGNLIESAIQHYELYKAMGEQISAKNKKESPALPKHPILKSIVESYAELYQMPEGATLVPQVLVTDVNTLRVGILDRLVVTGDKKGRVQDYKVNVNAEVEDKKDKALAPFDKLPANKLTKYQLQMSYYADMLKKSGWNIEGLDALVLDEEWKLFPLEVLSIN